MVTCSAMNFRGGVSNNSTNYTTPQSTQDIFTLNEIIFPLFFLCIK